MKYRGEKNTEVVCSLALLQSSSVPYFGVLVHPYF